jgi:hypothetical protein
MVFTLLWKCAVSVQYKRKLFGSASEDILIISAWMQKNAAYLKTEGAKQKRNDSQL